MNLRAGFLLLGWGLLVTPTQAQSPYQLPSVPRAYQQTISRSALEFQIEVGGTLDEFNTASYPNTNIGYTRLESLFQPNQYLLLENLGTTNVVNPRIVVNERRDWSSVESIFSSIFQPGMTDAEKATAIFYHTADPQVQTHDNNSRVGPEFPEDYFYPSLGTFSALANPVQASNSYYSSGCSPAAANLVILARQAGFDARVVWLSPEDRYRTHSVAEVFYDGGWHVFDPDSRAYFLERDNVTVASYQSLHEDPGLFDRTHLGGFASIGLAKDFGAEYEQYSPGRVMPVDSDWIDGMDMTLRPGERFVWRWDDDGKFRWGDNPRNRGFKPQQLANGKMIYQPHLDDSVRGRDATAQSNLRSVFSVGSGEVVLLPEVAGTTSSLIYQITSPYPIVGGLVGGEFLRASSRDIIQLFVSKDGEDWTRLWTAAETGTFDDFVSLDRALRAGPSEPIHDYFVKVELQGRAHTTDAVINDLYFETDVQMLQSSLPSLSVGNNTVVYTDEGQGSSHVRLIYGWQESSATRIPIPPLEGEFRKGTAAMMLQWSAAIDPDGDAIDDYHIQVSMDEAMRFPVSPNFDRFLFSDATQWQIPDGWLKPGSQYFWRVRAQDEWGAWSDWSQVWDFRTRGLNGLSVVHVPEADAMLGLLTGLVGLIAFRQPIRCVRH
jgi:hypothetical protein